MTKTASKSSTHKKSSLQAAIFDVLMWHFDVYSGHSTPEISSLNKNINNIKVFPDYLSVSYDHVGFFSANIRLDEDVFLLHLQKTSRSRPIYSSWPYVFKTFSRCLQDVLQKLLQDIFKKSSRCLEKHLQDVLKTSSRRLAKIFSRRIMKLNCPC